MGLDVPSGYEWLVKNSQVQKIIKKSLKGATIKLLSCDLEVTGSSHENNFLHSKINLRIIEPSPEPRISGSFVHRATH